jgi:hypothetical protein
MNFNTKEGFNYTIAEMVAAIIIHGTLFLAKCIVFCWVFNRLVQGNN